MDPGKGLLIVLVCSWALSTVGCASLKDYNRIKAANLALQSRTQSIESDLYDARSAADALKGRGASLDDQLAGKNAMVSNLQTENDRLAEMLRVAQLTVEDMANRYKPSDIAIGLMSHPTVTFGYQYILEPMLALLSGIPNQMDFPLLPHHPAPLL